MPRSSRPLAPALAAPAALALACAPPPRSPAQPPVDAIPSAAAGATVGVKPAILAAQLREPTLVDLEEGRTIALVIYLVLSVPVDPLTITPEHFVVALDDGRRVRPARALLSAAGNDRHTLTLALAGPEPPPPEPASPGPRAAPSEGSRPPKASERRAEPGRSERPSPAPGSTAGAPAPASPPAGAARPPALARPLALTISGNLFGAGGEPLSGLAAEVDAIDRPPRAVLARRLSKETGHSGCDPEAQVIRTTWTAPLAGDEALDLTAVTVVAADGARAHPSAAADLEVAPGALQRGDNVLDLCVPAGVGLARLRIDAGALRDLYGLASAAVDLPIARG